MLSRLVTVLILAMRVAMQKNFQIVTTSIYMVRHLLTKRQYEIVTILNLLIWILILMTIEPRGLSFVSSMATLLYRVTDFLKTGLKTLILTTVLVLVH